MHARGWRQLPNYAIWAGIGSFLKVCTMNVAQSVEVSAYLFPRRLNHDYRVLYICQAQKIENKCVYFHCVPMGITSHYTRRPVRLLVRESLLV